MKTKTCKFLMVMLVGAILLSAADVFARPGGRGEGQGRANSRSSRAEDGQGPGRTAGRNPAQLAIRMAQKLELTEQQIEELEQIEAPDPEKMAEHRELMRGLREELESAIFSGEPAEVEAAAEALWDEALQNALRKTEAFTAVKEILTQEQYEQFRQAIQQIHDERDRMREQRRERIRERFMNGEGFGPEGEQDRRQWRGRSRPVRGRFEENE